MEARQFGWVLTSMPNLTSTHKLLPRVSSVSELPAHQQVAAWHIQTTRRNRAAAEVKQNKIRCSWRACKGQITRLQRLAALHQQAGSTRAGAAGRCSFGAEASLHVQTA